MATITKGASGLVLTTAGNWVGGVAPTSADVARWASTSSSGNHTGSLTLQGVQIDGAAGTTVVGYTSGTLTLTQADAIVFGTSSTASFEVSSSGVIALGTGNRNFKIAAAASRAVGQVLVFNTNGALTGSGTLTIIDAAAGTLPRRQVVFGAAHTGFTGTVVFDGNVELLAWNTSQTCLTAANITVNGDLCVLRASAAGTTLGASGRTLTINNDVILGLEPWTIASNVVLAGTGTRTLTVKGNTTISGTVTGSNGVTIAGASQYTFLSFSGNSSGLTGPCVVSVGDLAVDAANRYAPTTIDVTNTTARFRYSGATSDFTFGSDVSGLGAVAISGNFAGNGVTFPAAPTAGNIATFGGQVQAQGVASSGFQNTKIRISELPAKLGFAGLAFNASPTATATITYTGAGQTKSTGLVIDSENNTSTASLTAGTYQLVSSGSGPIVLSGTVQRTNTAANASARMSLTLGGTNTGDNTLSGVISEVGTFSATLGITKVDAGRWVLSGSNTHTGQTDVSGGTLSAQSANALGGTSGTVIIRSGATLELNGGYTFDKRDADWEARSASGGIDSIGANTILCRNFALTESLTTFTVSTGNKLTIDPQLSGAVEGAITGVNLGIAKAGAGELELAANANTFSGAVTISAGTLTVGSVANGGVAAAWGQASSAVAVSATLKYNGATGSSSRAVQMTGSAPTINASGSGALTLSNVTQDTTAKTMTLRGTSTAANTVSNAIANNTGAVSLAKEDAGKWVLSGALSYTGTTAVNGGTLRVQTGNSNTTSGAVTIGASGTVELVTDTLASAGGTSGEVLGTGNVTVNGGTIKTRGGTTQKGQVRYGGNLTFGAGSTLYIGAAA